MSTFTLADISPALWMRSATALVRPWAPLDATLTIGHLIVRVDAGALTANVWKEVAALTGTGFVQFASLRQGNNTSQSIAGRLLIDGMVVDTATCGPSIVPEKGLDLVGNAQNAGPSVPGFVPFNQSARFEVRSDVARSAGESIKYCFRGTTLTQQAIAGTQLSKLRFRSFCAPAAYTDAAMADAPFAVNTVQAHNAVKDAGNLAANTWTPVETLTGSGVVQYVVVRQNSTTNQAISARLIIDSSILNATSATAGTVADNGIVMCGGNANAGTAMLSYSFLPFNESAVLEVKSSINRVAGSSITYTFGGYLT